MLISPVSFVEADPKRQQINQWFTDYHSGLFRYLVRILGDQEQAADILQDTFIRALGALGDEPPANPYAWLSRIASNLAIDHMRRARRWRWFVSQWREPERGIENEVATTQSVRLCLSQLKAKDAEVLLLSHYVGFSAGEIANLTGEEVSAIRVRLHRARQRFRALYEKEVSA